MLSIQISDNKNFMKNLLISETFDQFLLMQGSITTYNTYDIDGKIKKDFFCEEFDTSPLYGYEYTPWKQARELVFSLIKGKYTPLSFRFILYISPKLQNNILADASEAARENTQSLVLTIRYDGRGMSAVTGTSTVSFIPDKTAEEAWDNWIHDFFANAELN